MSSRNENLYIKDILDAINNIENYTKGISFEKFSGNQMIIDAVVRNFEIIGEAAKNLSKETKSSLSGIPWQDITAMRNKIIHEYFGVDLGIVWKAVKQDLRMQCSTVSSVGCDKTFDGDRIAPCGLWTSLSTWRIKLILPPSLKLKRFRIVLSTGRIDRDGSCSVVPTHTANSLLQRT